MKRSSTHDKRSHRAASRSMMRAIAQWRVGDASRRGRLRSGSPYNYLIASGNLNTAADNNQIDLILRGLSGFQDYTHDGESNRTRVYHQTLGFYWDYTFDHRNRLTSATKRTGNPNDSTPDPIALGVSYEYDVFDRRVSRTVDTNGNGTSDLIERFFYDGDHVLFDYVDPDGAAGGAGFSVQKRYLYGPAVAIGFTPQQIRRIAKKYSRKLVEVWSDVKLRKIERDGLKSFRRSPQAFLLDNLKHAARKERTLPDWYREERRAAEQARRDAERDSSVRLLDEELARAYRADRGRAFRDYVQAHVSREDYQQAVEIFQAVNAASLPADQAREQAIADAERHFEAGFRFPEFEDWRMTNAQLDSPPAR